MDPELRYKSKSPAVPGARALGVTPPGHGAANEVLLPGLKCSDPISRYTRTGPQVPLSVPDWNWRENLPLKFLLLRK